VRFFTLHHAKVWLGKALDRSQMSSSSCDKLSISSPRGRIASKECRHEPRDTTRIASEDSPTHHLAPFLFPSDNKPTSKKTLALAQHIDYLLSPPQTQREVGARWRSRHGNRCALLQFTELKTLWMNTSGPKQSRTPCLLECEDDIIDTVISRGRQDLTSVTLSLGPLLLSLRDHQDP
jgi:hypothetical protein